MFELELADITVQLYVPALIALGLAAGFASAMLGIGGGFIMVPVLNIVFGVPFPIAVGSALGVMVLTSLSGALRHRREGHGDIRLAALMVPFSLMGVELGARLVQVLKAAGTITLRGCTMPVVDLWGAMIYVILILAIAGRVLHECRITRRAGTGKELYHCAVSRRLHSLKLPPVLHLAHSGGTAISFWLVPAVAFPAGVASGFLGIGGGFLVTPALIYLLRLPTLGAVATSLLVIVCASGFGVATHAFKGNVSLVIVAFMLMGSILGAQLGARAAHRWGGLPVRTVFGSVMAAAALMVLLKLLVPFC